MTRKAYSKDLARSVEALRKISTEEKNFSKLDLFICHKTSINCIKGFKSFNKILRNYESLDFVIYLMAILMKPLIFLPFFLCRCFVSRFHGPMAL